MAERPRVLIEDWFPIDTIGAESMRERGASSALPPLYFLHVWWARRPLTASRAAILASVLPAWSPDWPEALSEKFPTREKYHTWFLKLCGIFGDPVAGRRLIQWAKERNRKLDRSPYAHKRAFTINPGPEYLEELQELLEYTWGTSDISVLDPFAGGGSIPFEALRYGFRTHANELNPVASVILKGTLDYPFRFGPDLARDIRKYGEILTKRVRERLEPFFPCAGNESIHAYIWARTVKCPYTGKPIPLSPNWWLRKGDKPVAVRPVFDPAHEEASFEIVDGKRACADATPDGGTVRRGNAVSPWAESQAVDGDYIKAEAKAGRMGQQLYAKGLKKERGFSFRIADEFDLEAAKAAERELERVLPGWEADGLVPRELYPEQSSDLRPLHYGMPNWGEFFSPRQLLSQVTFLEELNSIRPTIVKELGQDRAEAVIAYLGIALDKACDYNSRMARWDGTRNKIANTFDRHDFSFKWSHAEFDASRNLFPWVIDQVCDAYAGIAKLAAKEVTGDPGQSAAISLTRGSASDLTSIATRSISIICVDPPYDDNVMYAECSDFFYVWMKRSVGDVFPELFREELTDKDAEAVANEARFRSQGRNRKKLARQDYQRKMHAAFQEMHRVLKDEGVLTVMFTHKKVEAWDTLATSLIGAGFAIESSWPVHTESEHSLHQAKKNAAQSTILLTCRKRPAENEPVWWDDIKGVIRETAREKAESFEEQGIRGVDLYIATFGPTLRILSESWPVLTSETDETGEPLPLRPEVALDLAREEVIARRKRGLLLGRTMEFDPFTDWYLLAWDTFRAEEFPADEARKLAIALGLDLEADLVKGKKLLSKKSSSVVLRKPGDRRGRGNADPEAESFGSLIDAAHTAMLLYDSDGAGPCRSFLDRHGLRKDSAFRSLMQALVNAIPRVRKKDEFVRPEARVLEEMRLAFWEDLKVPDEDSLPEPEVEQAELFQD